MAAAAEATSSKSNPSRRTFFCMYPGCGAQFYKRAHLLRHELIHGDSRPYTCSSCEKSFRSACHLKRHSATHTGEKLFVCEYEGCSVACITKWNLRRHVKRTHQGPFECKKCGKEFKKNKALKEHFSLEHKSATVCCTFPNCGRVFPCPAKLKQHAKIHSSKSYTCCMTGCSQSFHLWSDCRRHMANCPHKEGRCEDCGKVFKEKSNLVEHKKIHSEEREVFQCPYNKCGRFYVKRYSLQVHIRSFHQNIRPYHCTKEFCGKSFPVKHLLLKHLENHPTLSSENARKKKEKVSRRMVTTTLSALTGHIPELQDKLSVHDVNSYVNGIKVGLLGFDSDDYDAATQSTDVILSEDEANQTDGRPLNSCSSTEPFAMGRTDRGALSAMRKPTEGAHSAGPADPALTPDDLSSQESDETISALTDLELTDSDTQLIIESSKLMRRSASECASSTTVAAEKLKVPKRSSSSSSSSGNLAGISCRRQAGWVNAGDASERPKPMSFQVTVAADL